MKIRKILVDFTKLGSLEIIENCHSCSQWLTTTKWMTLKRAHGSGWQTLTTDICQSHVTVHSCWLQNNYFFFFSISQIFWEYLLLVEITLLVGDNGKSSFQILVLIMHGKLRQEGCYMWYNDCFWYKNSFRGICFLKAQHII